MRLRFTNKVVSIVCTNADYVPWVQKACDILQSEIHAGEYTDEDLDDTLHTIANVAYNQAVGDTVCQPGVSLSNLCNFVLRVSLVDSLRVCSEMVCTVGQ